MTYHDVPLPSRNVPPSLDDARHTPSMTVRTTSTHRRTTFHLHFHFTTGPFHNMPWHSRFLRLTPSPQLANSAAFVFFAAPGAARPPGPLGGSSRLHVTTSLGLSRLPFDYLTCSSTLLLLLRTGGTYDGLLLAISNVTHHYNANVDSTFSLASSLQHFPRHRHSRLQRHSHDNYHMHRNDCHHHDDNNSTYFHIALNNDNDASQATTYCGHWH